MNPSERETVRVVVPGRPAGAYPVEVAAGAWSRLPERLREHAPAHRYALVTDHTVGELYGSALAERLAAAAIDVELIAIPAGEQYKTREVWAEVSDRMLAAGLGRDSALLALGGGVVGDLAGFVAATYLRGIPLVQLPTTLLAMIDSSVGGKTGVDTPAGKNLVGAFHPPRLVVADVDALASLPPRELRAGLAEAIKHGAVADAGYLARIERDLARLLEGDPTALAELALGSVRIKAEIVARDERETGPRKVLNFGHTVGHAIEAASGYRILHGEAIAMGIAIEAELGERLGVTEPGTAARLRAVLGAAGLPVDPPDDVDLDRVIALTRTDKKARRGRVEYALVERIGRAGPGRGGTEWACAVDEGTLREVLSAARRASPSSG